MATIAIIAGLALAGAGAGMGASAASKARKQQKKLAETPFIDPGTLQGQAVGGNLANLPALEKLGAGVNIFNQSQLMGMQRQAIPGFDAMRQKGGENILAMLNGQLPGDVSQAVTRSAAGRAVAGGFGGSGLHRGLQLRDLGLNSLQMMQQGISSAESWITNATASSVPQLWNMSQMFLTPAQLYQGAIQQRGQNMQVGTQANMMPSGESVMGGFLGNVGGTIAGAGLMGALAGSGAPAGAGAATSGTRLGGGSTITNPSNVWGGA